MKRTAKRFTALALCLLLLLGVLPAPVWAEEAAEAEARDLKADVAQMRRCHRLPRISSDQCNLSFIHNNNSRRKRSSPAFCAEYPRICSRRQYMPQRTTLTQCSPSDAACRCRYHSSAFRYAAVLVACLSVHCSAMPYYLRPLFDIRPQRRETSLLKRKKPKIICELAVFFSLDIDKYRIVW